MTKEMEVDVRRATGPNTAKQERGPIIDNRTRHFLSLVNSTIAGSND